jgi:myo-inositol-1(or 4)-monophosphatase
VLVREAGGYVTEIDGGADVLATGSTFAANAYLHEAIGKLLRAARPTVPVRDKRTG